MTSGDIPLPSLPTTQITEPEKLISVIFFAPSDGVEAKVSIPFLAAKIKREGKFPVVKTEIRIEEPIAARSAFGLYISHPPPTMTPLMPNASAVLSTAPRFDGSCILSSAIYVPLGSIVSNSASFRLTQMQKTPCASRVSERVPASSCGISNACSAFSATAEI